MSTPRPCLWSARLRLRIQLRSPLACRVRLAVAAAGLLAACSSVGPDYQRPALDLPSTVLPAADAGAAPERLAASAGPDAQWWRDFHAPALDALIARSLREHPGIAAGQAALQQAAALVRAQQGVTAPQLQAAYGATRQKTAAVLASPLSSADDIFNLHTLQLNLSYTPDVFGTNRRAIEGLEAGLATQQALLDGTRLSLAGSVAVAAIAEATLRAQREALNELLGIQRDLLARTRVLQAAGQLAEADVAAQEAALAALDAQAPGLERQFGQTRDLLKALVGAWPDEVLASRFELRDLTLPEALPLTLPSELLVRRPDLRAAEAQLKAASAALGVAAAARLPSLALGVNAYGQAGNRIADLFRSAGNFWALAGGVTQPLFDGGTLRARESAARAAYDQAAALYRETVISAFQNVADVLIALHADADGARTAQRAEQAARRSYDIAQRQFALGDLSGLALAQTQQAWLQARTQSALAEAARLSDGVALYVALGGGPPGDLAAAAGTR
jgi:NodT family efflux transporter outer membrane factor (OMF) lipoprotein